MYEVWEQIISWELHKGKLVGQDVAPVLYYLCSKPENDVVYLIIHFNNCCLAMAELNHHYFQRKLEG